MKEILLIINSIFLIIIKSEKTLTIFISAHKDFETPLFNTSIYKITTDSNQTLKKQYDFDVIYTDKNNELYNLKITLSELTKIYYIFKNYRPLPKYIGFVHYRSFFSFGNNPPDMNQIFKKHDVIVYYPNILKKNHYIIIGIKSV